MGGSVKALAVEHTLQHACFRWLLACCAVLLAWPMAQAEPLLLNDTPGMYQRVLTTPGAQLLDAPDGDVTATPGVFNAFYVFERKNDGDSKWLRVGPSVQSEPQTWIDAQTTLAWEHAVVMQFTPRVNRNRALFFDTDDDLKRFFNRTDLSAQLEQAAAADDGATGIDGLVAREPEEYVDPNDNFYLMPVLNSTRTLDPRRRRPITLYETASIPLSEDEEGGSDELRGGVIFVIDTTRSMQPYIDATLSAVEEFYDELRSDGGENELPFSFGLIGFRDRADLSPGIGYNVREYHPLEVDFDEEGFLDALRGMERADVSTRGWQEDGLNGLEAALRDDAWKHFFIKHIIFITDAGVRTGRGENGTESGFQNPDALSTEARSTRRQISISSLFLETDPDPERLEKARSQMESISRWHGGSSALYQIPNGSPDAIKDSAMGVLQDLRMVTDQTLSDADLSDFRNEVCPAEADLTPDDELRCTMIDRSIAMRLAWQGAQTGRQAPNVLRAWASSRAMENPNIEALSPHVLLTRNQVDDLYRALMAIDEAYASTTQDPGRFFETIKSVFLQAQRDASRLGGLIQGPSDNSTLPDIDNFQTLEDALPGYLQGLPFQTTFERIDKSEWLSMSPQARRSVIVDVANFAYSLESAFESDAWVTLNPDAPEGEAVLAVAKDWFP